MRQREDNITTMFETVHANFQRNHDLWVSSPAFVDLVSRLGGGIAVIRQRQSEQGPNGQTQEKRNTRDTVERFLLKIGFQLSALATKNNNPTLAAQIDFDRSTLDRLQVSELLNLAKTVQAQAKTNSKVLISDYLIPETDLVALDNAITALGEVKDAPRLAITDKHVATLSLPAAIDYVRGLLRNEADKMMEVFRDSQPDFYVSYLGARVIIDRPATRPAKTSATAETVNAPGSAIPVEDSPWRATATTSEHPAA
jgi:hypothetical protein